MTTQQNTAELSYAYRFIDESFTAADVDRCIAGAPAWADPEESDIGSSAPDDISETSIGWTGPAVEIGESHARLYRLDRYSRNPGLTPGELTASFWMGHSDLVEIGTPQEARDAALVLLQIADDLEQAASPQQLPEVLDVVDPIDGSFLFHEVSNPSNDRHLVTDEMGAWSVGPAQPKDVFASLDDARAYLLEVASLIALAERLNAAGDAAESVRA